MQVKPAAGIFVGDASNASKDIYFLLLGAVTILSVSLSGLWFGAAAYAGLVFVCTLTSPVLGAAMWFIPAPFEAVAVTQNEIAPYLFVTPAYLAGSIFWLVNQPRNEVAVVPVMYSLLLSVSVTVGAISEGGWHELRSVISVMVSLFVAVVALTAVKSEPQRAHVILVAVVVSALSAVTYSVISFSGGWRLTMASGWGGGARALDASVGLALAVCLTVIFARAMQPKNVRLPIAFLGHGRLVYILTGLLTLALLATVSRGAILAIVVGTVLTSLLHAFRALFRHMVPSQLLVIVIGITLALFAAEYLDRTLTNGQLSSRVLLAISDPGENARWSIWTSGISSLSGYEWLIGSGVGSFQEITGWSPHSLYVGVLVETGILGLLLLATGMFSSLAIGIRRIRLPFLIFFVYVALSFATKGSLFDKNLYYAAVIAWALMETLSVSHRGGVGGQRFQIISSSQYDRPYSELRRARL